MGVLWLILGGVAFIGDIYEATFVVGASIMFGLDVIFGEVRRGNNRS
jgi:hypothetical protein